MRAISTVVDVAVFLLLVSAAVATLTLVPDGEPRPVVVDERADLLASTTADVEYTLRGTDRRAHGTVAWLLARGAVANASLDGRSLSPGNDDFVDQVRTVTRTTLGSTNRTQVIVRWEPYRGAPLCGVVRVGADPPPGRDVTVATLSVPAPADRPRISGGTGFRGVASAAARATTDTLLPESHATLPSGRVSPAATVTAHRSRVLSDGSTPKENLSAARASARDGLAAEFETDLRERFETPGEAADALRVERVRLTLRRWEP